MIRRIYRSILCSDDPPIICASHCFADMLCVPKDFGTPLGVESPGGLELASFRQPTTFPDFQIDWIVRGRSSAQ